MNVRAGFESLHTTLVGPSLDDDPICRLLKARIKLARAAHMPVKAYAEALQARVNQLLRGRA